jgi:hypothetical protein
MAGKLVDPIEKVTQKKAEDEDIKFFDIAKISAADFKPITARQERPSHPFEGYPVKPKVEYWHDAPELKDPKPVKVSATYIVALSPTVSLPHPPHNRLIRDYGAGINVDVVFDKKMKLSDGNEMKNLAIVENPNIRAQLMFKLNPRKEGLAQIERDARYLLLDRDQGGRLRRVFQMIHSPRMRRERLSAAISGESNEKLEDIPEE